MQKHVASLLMLSFMIVVGCVENDFIDDRVAERLSIDNPIDQIQLNETYQLNVTFFDNIGQPASATLRWFSSNTEVATISDSGLITALSEGSTTIRITTNLEDGSSVSQENRLTVSSQAVADNPISKSGSISSTSSYVLTGDFTISEIGNSQDLNLEIMSNYQASTSLPGLYLYLSNNPRSINGALEVAAVQVFNGAHSYRIENTEINQYKYLLYWCKPFSVEVGVGEIND